MQGLVRRSSTLPPPRDTVLPVIAASGATHREKGGNLRRSRATTDVANVPLAAIDDLNRGLITPTVGAKLAGTAIGHVLLLNTSVHLKCLTGCLHSTQQRCWLVCECCSVKSLLPQTLKPIARRP